DKLIEKALAVLERNDDLYQQDGATWFRSSRYGDEKDRVVIRDNGQHTYVAPDIAYHYDKRQRGMDILLDVLGSDHHGYVARIRAGLQALGEPADALEVQLMQFVTLYRGGEKAQMSTRSGQFITLRELRNDVGNDAARLFYVMRSNDQHLNFDVDLARSRTEENPVYYIQYAHARICNVFGKLDNEGQQWNRGRGLANLVRLDHDGETALVGKLSRFPEVIELAAHKRAPHHVVHYLRELASDLNSYYNDDSLPPIIRDTEAERRDARLALFAATRQVLANGLALLGVSAPASM
ncbi:MAG: arginine--tRNA ligase, partial [Gammaproteobacteria bacterium]|nr:arginine--tRNA ligase [Gammaproteobacteria bacterium]